MKTKHLMALALCFLIAGAAADAQNKNGQDLTAKNIIVVIDSSGSMGESWSGGMKMQSAKAALKTVIGNLPADVNIGILSFHKVVYPLSKRDDAKIMPAIDQIVANGGTPLGAYIEKGANILLSQKAKKYGYGSYQLIVITDGAASDKGQMNRMAPEVKKRGLRFDVIGVDMPNTHDLAKWAHSYKAANDANALQQAIQAVLVENVGGGQGAGANFDDVEALDPAVARAMCAALCSAQGMTHGLGKQPPKPPQPPESGVQKQAAAPMSNTQGQQPAGSNGSPLLYVVIGLGIIALLVGTRIAKSRSR